MPERDGSAPEGVPTNDDAVEAFLRIIEATAALGVSCIVEYVVRQARPVDLERLVAAADCRVIETRCRGALTRFAARNRSDPLLNRQPVLGALGFTTIDEHAREAVRRMQASSPTCERSSTCRPSGSTPMPATTPISRRSSTSPSAPRRRGREPDRDRFWHRADQL